MGVKSRLQTLQLRSDRCSHLSYATIDDLLSYREQIEKVSRLKEETIRGIIKNSHDIAIFKEEVSKHLRELREFAEGE